MKESKLIGTLIPGIPEYHKILKDIRIKYDIPSIEPDDDIIELFAKDIPYEDIYQDIYNELQNLLPIPEPFRDILLKIRSLPEDTTIQDALIEYANTLPGKKPLRIQSSSQLIKLPNLILKN